MTVEKPKPKQLLRPITTGAGSAMNQSQFLAILCNSLQAREKSGVHGAIGFGFASHWLKNWRESFKPITQRSNRDHVFTFDSHLKTALFPLQAYLWLNCNLFRVICIQFLCERRTCFHRSVILWSICIVLCTSGIYKNGQLFMLKYRMLTSDKQGCSLSLRWTSKHKAHPSLPIPRES